MYMYLLWNVHVFTVLEQSTGIECKAYLYRQYTKIVLKAQSTQNDCNRLIMILQSTGIFGIRIIYLKIEYNLLENRVQSNWK